MCVCGGNDGEKRRGLWELFVLSAQYFCTLEATLKIFLNSKKLKIKIFNSEKFFQLKNYSRLLLS